ncbi:hypothetical protein [Candidatus Erwinia haradaeae]|nr:hypothetical protein [Candidatus Erwinia haradaeae]
MITSLYHDFTLVRLCLRSESIQIFRLILYRELLAVFSYVKEEHLT